jgi:2,4-dienoyl-CoA reductase-like NADH-dependent reductase (Old Yellow Enzyme family)
LKIFKESRKPSWLLPSELRLLDVSNITHGFQYKTHERTVDFIEIHAAHGYLFNSFMSPLSNDRTDQYGGSFENRIRLPIEVAESVRAIWNKPLLLRLSATEWAQELGPEKDENGEWKWWGPEQSVLFSERVLKAGVDLLDVSSGGNYSKQKITVGPGYQVSTPPIVLDHNLILF